MRVFAQQLRAAGLSSDDAELDHLAALGSAKGLVDMEDLMDLNEADVQLSVEHMLLTTMQLNKLLKWLRVLETASPSKMPRRV